MGNIKHIIAVLVGSMVLLALIALWVGHKTGDMSLLGTSSSNVSEDGPLPGPLGDQTEPSQALPTDTTQQQTTMEQPTNGQNPVAIFKTNRGDISILLYRDRMPITVDNFVKLAKEDFYDNSKFHRVIEGFMIQGGDPNSKGDNTAIYGQGGPGYTIQDEFVADPELSNVRGTIAMANTGQPNSGGSQFFINLVDNLGLDFDKDPASSKHPVFGKVIGGMDVVDAIGKTTVGPRDLPVDPVIINDIEIR